MIKTFRARRDAALQAMHSAGTCPSCRGSGVASSGLMVGPAALRCGPCGGSGRSR